jgi:ABC transport system ATP-binding/permease protein
VLFSTSCFANVLGLNISSAFKSAVTVYIMIPLLLIPQMILSGLLFSFDKLNNLISTKGKVPIVADLMASRWAYEALAVYQFKNNDYEREYFEYEQNEASADFKAAYLADDLIRRNHFILENYQSKNDSSVKKVNYELTVLRNTLSHEEFREGIENLDLNAALRPEAYNEDTGLRLSTYFNQYKRHYQKVFNDNAAIIEKKMAFIEKNGRNVSAEKDEYRNESLADLVKNVTVKQRLLEYKGRIIQQINPVFQTPPTSNPISYRTAFFFSEKNFLGTPVSTYVFNMLVIWSMSLVFYLTLYFEVFGRLIKMFGKFRV